MSFPQIFTELIEELTKFPGIGRRSAERIAFHILKMPQRQLQNLIQKMEELHKHIKPCKFCNNFTEQDLCSICSNPNRQQDIVCVVEEPKDVFAIEKTSQYNGLYYVLLGSVSPLEGISGEDLNISKLINRIETGKISEVIIATDPDSDGELTAQFLIKKISIYKVKIYRIAIGVPLGTQIEYIDSATLAKAILERRLI